MTPQVALGGGVIQRVCESLAANACVHSGSFLVSRTDNEG